MRQRREEFVLGAVRRLRLEPGLLLALEQLPSLFVRRGDMRARSAGCVRGVPRSACSCSDSRTRPPSSARRRPPRRPVRSTPRPVWRRRARAGRAGATTPSVAGQPVVEQRAVERLLLCRLERAGAVVALFDLGIDSCLTQQSLHRASIDFVVVNQENPKRTWPWGSSWQARRVSSTCSARPSCRRSWRT